MLLRVHGDVAMSLQQRENREGEEAAVAGFRATVHNLCCVPNHGEIILK